MDLLDEGGFQSEPEIILIREGESEIDDNHKDEKGDENDQNCDNFEDKCDKNDANEDENDEVNCTLVLILLFILNFKFIYTC